MELTINTLKFINIDDVMALVGCDFHDFTFTNLAGNDSFVPFNCDEDAIEEFKDLIEDSDSERCPNQYARLLNDLTLMKTLHYKYDIDFIYIHIYW